MEWRTEYDMKHERFYRRIFVNDNSVVGKVCLVTGGALSLVGVATGLLLDNYLTLWAGIGVFGWGIVSTAIASASKGRFDAKDIARRMRPQEPGRRILP